MAEKVKILIIKSEDFEDDKEASEISVEYRLKRINTLTSQLVNLKHNLTVALRGFDAYHFGNQRLMETIFNKEKEIIIIEAEIAHLRRLMSSLEERAIYCMKLYEKEVKTKEVLPVKENTNKSNQENVYIQKEDDELQRFVSKMNNELKKNIDMPKSIPKSSKIENKAILKIEEGDSDNEWSLSDDNGKETRPNKETMDQLEKTYKTLLEEPKSPESATDT